MPVIGRERVKTTGISIVSDTRIDHLGRWPVNYIRGHAQGITLETTVYRRVRFRSCGTVGYGPTMWLN